MAKGYAAFAAIVATALVATPLLIGTGKALATSEETGTIARTVTVAAVEPAPAAAQETCNRKVRVVYSGYGTPPVTCTALR